jgi:hypothetical protein
MLGRKQGSENDQRVASVDNLRERLIWRVGDRVSVGSRKLGNWGTLKGTRFQRAFGVER